VTIAHNTFLDNAHYGIEQIVVSERVYGPKRMAEASNEAVIGNLFFSNKAGAMYWPLTSPRSRDNVSDHNAIEPGAKFGINTNGGRIPIAMIQRECRDRLQVGEVPKVDWPDLSDPKQLPVLSLDAWRAVMQVDMNTTALPAKFHMQLGQGDHLRLQIDLPTRDAIPATPPGGFDDIDLLGKPVGGKPIAGAIQDLHEGSQTLDLWPLPASTRPASAETK
jgi:hypothetical protein